MSSVEGDEGGAVPEMSPVRGLFESFRANYAVTDHLVVGIDLDQPDLWLLLTNFAQSGFRWTGSVRNWQEVLAGALDGDCQSLVEACLHLARDGFGFDVGYGHVGADLFIPGGGAITDGRTGNVDHGAHWVFTGHYWLTTAAFGPIDLLFRGVAAEANWIEESESGTERVNPREVADWRRFGDWIVWYAGTGDPTHAYTTNPDEAARTPSRSEEARREDEQRQALEAGEDDDDEEQVPDTLETVLAEMKDLSTGLPTEWESWTAQVVFSKAPKDIRERMTIYKEFASGVPLNPVFDRPRWNGWVRSQGANPPVG
ncbi:MAG: hypothetical protein ACRD0D_02415 [Acidimicrobiales bacterium]